MCLPDNFTTLDEFWGFSDTHSSADYEDAMEAVDIEIDSSSSTVYLPVVKDFGQQSTCPGVSARCIFVNSGQPVLVSARE